MSGHKFGVKALQWMPDSSRIVSGSYANDPSLRVWDANNGTELKRLEHAAQEYIGTIAISPDARFVATSGMSDVIIWDLQKEQVIQSLEYQVEGSPLAFIDPTGERLAVGNRGDLLIFDVQSGNRLQKLQANSIINDISVTPDGSKLYTAGLDSMILVWGESTISNAETMAMPDTVTMRPLHRLTETSGTFTAATFASNPDGAYVGHSHGQVFGVNLTTGGKVMEYGKFGGSEVTTVEASQDGKILAVGDKKGNVTLYEPSTARVLARYEESRFEILGLSFFPDSRRLAVGARDQGFIAVIDATTGKMINSIKGGRLEHDLFVLPDSEKIFIQGEKGSLVLNLNDGSVVKHFQGGGFMQEGGGFAADGSLFVLGGNGSLSSFSISSARPVKSVKVDGIVRLTRASETGKYVAVVVKGRVYLYDGKTMQYLSDVPVGRLSAIYEVAVNEVTKRVLIAGSKDSQADLQIWEFE